MIRCRDIIFTLISLETCLITLPLNIGISEKLIITILQNQFEEEKKTLFILIFTVTHIKSRKKDKKKLKFYIISEKFPKNEEERIHYKEKGKQMAIEQNLFSCLLLVSRTSLHN